jgi:hypothetical protein
MMTYSEPKKNYKGLWEVTVKDERGFTVLIQYKTTKKSILAWLKEHKQQHK